MRAAAETESADWSAGFLVDEFDLTLKPGHRLEAAGPFYYSERLEDESTVAVPPLFSAYKNSAIRSGELHLLYPLASYGHYEDEWRWQFFQLLSFAGGRQAEAPDTRRFTIFPIYFQQRSADARKNYTALMPVYGHLQNRLFRDEIFFVLFPAYIQTRKRDVITDNYLFPFVHVREGNGLRGWQVFPIIGRETKTETLQTNGFDEVTTVPGHKKSFLLWPIWLSQDRNLGTTNPETFRASIPLAAVTRSPQRDVTSVLWPFFSWIEDRDKKYREWQGPWPFVIFTRGEGKTTDRIWPLFSQSRNDSLQSDSYLWPIYTYKRKRGESLDWQAMRIFFYLYVGVSERNTVTGAEKLRRDAWPFFTWRKDFKGNTRLQVLAPLESVLSSSRGIERNWSPVWSVWRAEKNPAAGRRSQSLLWNLYRCDETPEHKKISLLFGLFQYEKTDGKSRKRLFYFPITR